MPGLVTATATGGREMTISGRLRPPQHTDWAEVAAALAPIACERDTPGARRRSRDYFWFSPVLKPLLEGVRADLVVTPADEGELIRVVTLCVQRGLPLTPRGAGTGNYGQAMPLHGGVVVDLTRLAAIRSVTGGVARVGAGARLADVEAAAAVQGWELRFHPSTWKTATIGGFVAGGSTGCGGINFGALFDPGNVLGLRLLTMEEAPRLLELRGADVRRAVHAYGCTGIITEVEMALAPAARWIDLAVSAPTAADALRIGEAIARADGVRKKLVTALAWEAAKHQAPLRPFLLEGQAAVLLMIAEESADTAEQIATRMGGRIVYRRSPEEVSEIPPLYEFSYNHVTLHALREDPAVTYIQSLHAGPNYLQILARLEALFGDEVPLHLEYSRMGGEIVCFGLHLIRYSSHARLEEIMATFRANGCPIFSPHTYLLESDGMPTADPEQYESKLANDPYGLLNPGKMPGWATPQAGFFVSAA